MADLKKVPDAHNPRPAHTDLLVPGSSSGPYASQTVYSSKAALSLNRSHDRNRSARVSVEGALRSRPSGPFDWSSKISIQLAPRESLELAAAVRLGSASISIHHGSGSTAKSLTLERQGLRYFCRLTGHGRYVQLPIEPADQVLVTAFLLSECRSEFPGLTDRQFESLFEEIMMGRLKDGA